MGRVKTPERSAAVSSEARKPTVPIRAGSEVFEGEIPEWARCRDCAGAGALPATNDGTVDAVDGAEPCRRCETSGVDPEALHDWFDPHGAGYRNLRPGLISCRRCGTVRARDGSSDTKPCRGPVRMGLRAEPAASLPF